MDKPYLRLRLNVLASTRTELLQQLHDFIVVLEETPIDSFHQDALVGFSLDQILVMGDEVPLSSAQIEVVS